MARCTVQTRAGKTCEKTAKYFHDGHVRCTTHTAFERRTPDYALASKDWERTLDIARVELQAATRELEAASLPHEALHTAYGQATTRCDRCVRAFIARTRLVDARALVDALEAQKEEDY